MNCPKRIFFLRYCIDAFSCTREKTLGHAYSLCSFLHEMGLENLSRDLLLAGQVSDSLMPEILGYKQ
jgi:hypothetical protein